jgi:hypothetical protein
MVDDFKVGYSNYFNDYFLFENNYNDNDDFDDDIHLDNNDDNNNNNNNKIQKQKQEIIYNPENLKIIQNYPKIEKSL